MTPSPFGQATRSGLLSMQPPAAKPTQPALFGAMMESAMSKGAAEASGMAILYVTPLVGSGHSSIFCPWTTVDMHIAPTKVQNFIVRKVSVSVLY